MSKQYDYFEGANFWFEDFKIKDPESSLAENFEDILFHETEINPSMKYFADSVMADAATITANAGLKDAKLETAENMHLNILTKDDELFATVRVKVAVSDENLDDKLPNNDSYVGLEYYDWEDFEKLGEQIQEQEDDETADFIKGVESIKSEGRAL